MDEEAEPVSLAGGRGSPFSQMDHHEGSEYVRGSAPHGSEAVADIRSIVELCIFITGTLLLLRLFLR